MRFARHARTAGRVIDGQAAVVSIDENRVYTLNGTASEIWQALAEPRSAEELAVEISAAYEVDAQTASDDCQRFCEEMAGLGLLVCLP